MLSRVATNANFIVFGLTYPGLEPTIYREHADQYDTDAVYNQLGIISKLLTTDAVYNQLGIISKFLTTDVVYH